MTRRGAFRWLAGAVDCVVFVSVLCGTLGVPTTTTSSSTHAVAAAPDAPESSPATLQVSPPSFFLRAGENVTLTALWSNADPLCALSPIWFRWAVLPGNASGRLNATVGAAVTFEGESFNSGTVTVAVHSAAITNCSGNESVAEDNATTNVSVAAPFALTDLTVEPNPLLPGENATLSGVLVGGMPPYTVTVDWGDGSSTRWTLAAPGSFGVNHTFEAGTFLPTAFASDLVGETAAGMLAEAVSIGLGLQVSITPSATVVDLGNPVTFVGTVVGPSSDDVPLFACSNASLEVLSNLSGNSTTTRFECTFSSVGTEDVLFGEFPTEPGEPSATAVLYESVVPSPRLSTAVLVSTVPTGEAFPVQVAISGGTLPAQLSWTGPDNESGTNEIIHSDGVGVVWLGAGTPGVYTRDVRIVDDDGLAAVNSTALTTVEPPLQAEANARSMIHDAKALVTVSVEVVSGSAPFLWWVAPGFDPSESWNVSGVLVSVGTVAWTFSYTSEGNLSISVGVVDLAGEVWQASFGVPLLPPLQVSVVAFAVESASSPLVVAVISISEGVAPFQVRVTASDCDGAGNYSLAEVGRLPIVLQPNGTGVVELTIEVSDAAQELASAESSVVVAPVANQSGPSSLPNSSTPPSPASPNASAIEPSALAWLTVPLALPIVAGAVALFLRRRKRNSPPTPEVGPDPVQTLRDIIEPADGAERFTVELLAEEAGVSLATVRSTISRLVADGRVISERGADGEEVLSWAIHDGK